MKIGVIGGGQLAQMMALAGYPLGLKVICLEPTPDCSASLVTDVIVGNYDDVDKLHALARAVDVITYEFENIPAAVLATLDNSPVKTPLFPASTALAISQDRLQEKRFFEQLSIPTTHYADVDSFSQLEESLERVGFPAILKTRRLGYDGKGQQGIETIKDAKPAWEVLKDQALLLENKIVFEREVSCIAVRGKTGEIVFYPLVENEHKKGILHLSRVSHDSARMEKLAQDYMTRILTTLDYVGVLTVEFFQKEGQLIANEMAPRVHNSGHWTIEGADTSQFENHLRAVCGLPLGSTMVRGEVAMMNLVGKIPVLADMLSIPHTHCHLYGKAPREGRKLGHLTVCTDKQKEFDKSLEKILALI